MKFTAAVATLLAGTALAAPAAQPAGVKSMATTQTWTITGLKRVCDSADDSCAWSFGIKAGTTTTACGFTVKKAGSTPADQSPETGATCGAYTVTSGWSGQFGAGNGFTTLSVVNSAAKLIAWPAYTDKQLAGGATVKPDQSYPVQSLPN